MPHATATDGVKLYYEEAGDGPPILFIHEFAGDWRAWDPQVTHFGRRRRCIVYSARGYPGSDVPENIENYSQDIARADALAVLDHLGIEKAHIVGLSMGGLLSFELWRQAPECITQLALLDTNPRPDTPERQEDRRRQLRMVTSGRFPERTTLPFGDARAANA